MLLSLAYLAVSIPAAPENVGKLKSCQLILRRVKKTTTGAHPIRVGQASTVMYCVPKVRHDSQKWSKP